MYLRIRKSKEKQLTAELEQKALRAQMNPHFIFNSLNSIQRLYIEGEEDIANDYMADFSNLLRRILENSSMDKVSLKEELRSTILYLDLEKMRTDNLFNYEIEIDPNVDQLNTFVPPLILQPYLENAIWHGIMPKNEQGKITLRINKIEKIGLECIITDNGIGMKESLNQKGSTMRESKGMSITSDRLGGENHVFISELESGGTEVKLRIRKIK
jgi:sensor histidine kinase YesM